MNDALYDRVGVGYNSTRCADPYLAARMYELLSPKEDGLYLDIGCGTGNYLHALTGKGGRFYGIDPSETMLNEARENNPATIFINASAEALPIEEGFFNGAIATFTLHHWKDLQKGLCEVNRVLRPGSRFVILSWTPEQILNYWLNHYFPQTMRNSSVTPPLNEMEQVLNQAGFSLSGTEKYFVREDLQDHFLYSNKFRPEQYLRPEVRNGASTFTVFADQQEVERGLIQLEADIASGKIADVMKQYENDLGDYLFLIAEKQ